MESETVVVRPPVWAVFTIVIIGGLFFLGGKYIEKKDLTPLTISVTGEGKASGVPDLAMLSLGMQTGRQNTAKDAMALLTKNMNAVIDAVKKAGVDEKDISTQNFSLNPAYDYTPTGMVPKGFEASQSLEIKVRDLDKASDVLSAATAAGANQAGGVQFTIDNPEKVRAEAREKAVKQAQEKAELLAKNLGKSLGRMRGFSEGGVYAPPMMYDKAMSVMGMGGGGEAQAMPLPAGEQEVQAQVTLTYELR